MLPKLRLFMVPCAAARAPSAPNKQFVTACEVSTLPATTADGYSGESIDRLGITILMGLRQPAFIGMASSTITRNTYKTAARVTGSGALKLVGCCLLVPVKSTVASRFFLSTAILTVITVPWSIL